MKNWIIASAVGGALGFFTALNLSPQAPAFAQSGGDVYQQLEIFGDILDRVRVSYVEDVDEAELIESAINGMLASLDPHSGYLPPVEADEMAEQTRGKFGGLGIEVTMEEGLVKVIAPIDGTPAQEAGVQAGDYISQLDGEAVLGLTLNEAVDRMRGDPDTDITITILREGADEPIEITLTRAVITVFPVKARREGDIAYLRVTQFNEQTTDDLVSKLTELKEEIGGDDLRGYVLDLRNNPGGLLNQAVSVSDIFLDRGEIVSTRGRDESDAERRNATEGDLAEGMPVVVLVNGGSASASEIVAGALQDHRRAVIVGTKTFGKGSVQTIRPLNNQGALKLTTARYYTPSGRSIQALGIEPDVVVEQIALDEQDENGRLRRSEGSLRGALDSDSEADAQRLELEAAHAAREELRRDDYQLAYALDLIDGVSALDRLRTE